MRIRVDPEHWKYYRSTLALSRNVMCRAPHPSRDRATPQPRVPATRKH